MTAGSMLKCSLDVDEPSISPCRRLCESVLRAISRCPINVEANRDVPPPSLEEQRSIKELPQFSIIVCAAPAPYVLATCATD
jgi:hypothetical protein